MDPNRLCLGCMSPRGAAEICVRCGYRANTPPESPLHLTPGTVLSNQYMVGRVLGHGGFGITYIGWDIQLERKLAVKEYFPSGVALRSERTVTAFSGKTQHDYDYGLERYLEEARLVVKFAHHPNILSVINFFKENGTAYIVMEYLDGQTLEQHLHNHAGRLVFDDTLRLLLPVMDALDEMHHEGILHRDISPDNIHIGKDGLVKVLDFGAARLAMGERSKNLSVILKEGYAPPEQYRSKGNQGPWTDIYALAATFYRCATGILPPAALDRMGHDELKPPRALGAQLTDAQESILLKALSFDAAARFQTMREFRTALAPHAPPLAARAPTAAFQARSDADLAPTVRITPPSQDPPADLTPYPPVNAAAQWAFGDETGVIGVVPSQPVAKKKKVPVWAWVAGVAVAAGVGFLALRPAQKSSQTPPAVQQPVASASSEKPVNPATRPPPAKQAAPTYSDLLHKATQAEAANGEEAVTLLNRAIAAAPSRWEAHSQMAQVLLYKLDRPAEAAAEYSKAIALGGLATFRVLHAHKDQEPAPARFLIGKDTVALDEQQEAHTFSVARKDVKEFRRNRDVLRRLVKKGAGPSMFHIVLSSGEKYNLAGSSAKPNEEREMIFRLGAEK